MPRSRSLAAALPLLVALALAGCGGGDASGRSTTPSGDPVAAELQSQLDELPPVDGATRTAQRLDGSTLTESFTVPAGTPACLQLLARLDAGGYEVVTGTTGADGTAVDPGTCRTTDGAAGVDTTSGTATILARGGSQVALTWTTTSYTVTVTAS